MRRLFSLFAVLALFFASGCGSDDETPASTDDTADSTETTETTAAEDVIAFDDWAEQADEICADTDESMDELGEPLDVDEVVEMLPDALEIQQEQVDALTELGIPDDEADSVEEAIGLLNDQIELLEGALSDIEDGEDAGDVFSAINDEGEQLDDDIDDLAVELGLEECGSGGSSDDPTTSTTVDEGGSDEPFTYGDDADLDELWDACEAGDPDACDSLYLDSPIGSEYEEFGLSCGGVVPDAEYGDCAEVLDSADFDNGDDEIGVDPYTYGDDPALDEMWDDCEDGRPEACDDLFRESPVDSEYEEFGRTCGGRLEGIEAQTTYCVDAM